MLSGQQTAQTLPEGSTKGLCTAIQVFSRAGDVERIDNCLVRHQIKLCSDAFRCFTPMHSRCCTPAQVFSRAGDIKRIIMGLDKHQMTPCGFAFVVYYTRQDAEDAVKYISGTIMDDRPIRVDFDWGFKDGRQFGRGRSGGQVGTLHGPLALPAKNCRCGSAQRLLTTMAPLRSATSTMLAFSKIGYWQCCAV